MRRTWSVRVAVAVLISVGMACGGGGGGGPTGPPAIPPGINFTPAGGASAESVYLAEGAQTSASKLYLEVRANQVEDLYGVAFDLAYPSNLLSYLRVNEGGFLGSNTSLEVVEKGAGLLIVGHTRLGPESGRDGSGLLMTLEFLPVGSGSGSFEFQNAQAFRTNSFPQTVEFIAGSVSVQP